jgi:hypothetical protein
MAYVPNAKRDIFISYPIEAEEWAQHFEQDLRKELEQWLPAGELRTYLAKRDWHMVPSDKMLDEARNAAFYIATLIPGALSHDGLRFFQQEWEAFAQSARMFGSVDTRFAPVLIKPIDSRRIAQFFPLGNEEAFWRPFEFYFEDKAGIPHTLLRNSRKCIYCKKIAAIAWHIKQRLVQIKEQAGAEWREQQAAAAPALGPFSGMKVLLGESGEGLSGEWQEVRQLLINDGVEVVPSGEFPQDYRGFEELLKRELERADLFVQLLNPLGEASRLAEAEASGAAVGAKSRAQLSYECALAYLKTTSRPFGILQWRDPKIIRGALRYWPEELLDSAHVQAVGLQQFKQAIRAKLEDLRKPPPPSPTSKPFLFIMADQPDLNLANQLSEAALDHADVDVLTETEQDRKEHFLEAMRIAAGVIILHGKAPIQFINNWLSMYVREKAKLKRSSQLDALYRAPPRKQSNEEPRIPSRDLRTMGSEELFTLDGIRQLCKELGGAH